MEKTGKVQDRLLDWKSRFAGKYALMLDGARRVGKSWLAETFAKSEYDAYVMIDFTKVKQDVKELFEEYLDDLETFFMLLQTKFRAYIDYPTVLGVKDFNGNNTVRAVPIFATPAILETF